jgi:tryptophan synthase alpha chain
MSRIEAALDRAREQGRAALVTYVCGGDPDLASTKRLLEELPAAGADVIELGMPFSDPTADGASIQRAAERALRAGTTLDSLLDCVARAKSTAPVVLFGYYNPLHGREADVVARAASAGIDGLLVVDLPPEESAPLREPARASGMDWIPLVAPTSTAARIERAAASASSFVYVISVAGVTGSAPVELDLAARRANELGKTMNRRVALGFGIKTAADVATVAPHVDAVVVGSALVDAIAQGGVDAGLALVRELAAAARR